MLSLLHPRRESGPLGRRVYEPPTAVAAGLARLVAGRQVRRVSPSGTCRCRCGRADASPYRTLARDAVCRRALGRGLRLLPLLTSGFNLDFEKELHQLWSAQSIYARPTACPPIGLLAGIRSAPKPFKNTSYWRRSSISSNLCPPATIL